MNVSGDEFKTWYQSIRTEVSQYEYNDRKLIFQHKKLQLYHYLSAPKNKTPLLVVFATINRPEILDLFPKKSFIHGLLAKGFDVYLLDWGCADHDDVQQTFVDYFKHDLACIIDVIKKTRQVSKINLLGICQGGVIALCYTATHADISNLILISTPVDCHSKKNVMANLIKTIPEQLLSAKPGLIPGQFIYQFFLGLRPFDTFGQKYLRYLNHFQDVVQCQKIVRFEKWLQDSLSQPQIAISEFVHHIYAMNALMSNEFQMGNVHISLKDIRAPVLNIVAAQDKIVPPQSSLALKKLMKMHDYTANTIPAGHISIYIKESVTENVTASIARWLNERT